MSTGRLSAIESAMEDFLYDAFGVDSEDITFCGTSVCRSWELLHPKDTVCTYRAVCRVEIKAGSSHWWRSRSRAEAEFIACRDYVNGGVFLLVYKVVASPEFADMAKYFTEKNIGQQATSLSLSYRKNLYDHALLEDLESLVVGKDHCPLETMLGTTSAFGTTNCARPKPFASAAAGDKNRNTKGELYPKTDTTTNTAVEPCFSTTKKEKDHPSVHLTHVEVDVASKSPSHETSKPEGGGEIRLCRPGYSVHAYLLDADSEAA